MEQQILKILFIKKRIAFPFCTLTIAIKTAVGARDIKKGDSILAFTVRTVIDLLFYRKRLATFAEVADITHNDKTVILTLKGLFRVRIKRLIKFKQAEFILLDPGAIESHEAIMDDLRKKSQELVFLINVEESDKLIKLLNYIVDLNQMSDFIANYFVMDFSKRYMLYSETDLKKRGRMLISELSESITKMTKKRKKRSP